MGKKNEIATVETFSQELGRQRKQLESLLPASIKPEYFMRTVVNGIQMHRDKIKLLNANRESLFQACQKAAQDGLMLDGREATLVVFGSEATYMPMTQGIVKLARNSGEIGKIEAYVVYEQDGFKYRPGTDDLPMFEPDWKTAPSKKGVPYMAYAVIQLKSGDPIIRIMHVERIMQIAKGTKNANQYDPKKGNHFEEWWKKTVIKAALKYAPRSSELDKAINHDNENYDFAAVDEPAEPEKKVQGQKMQSVDDINSDLAEASDSVNTNTGEVLRGELIGSDPQQQDDDPI